MIFDPAHVDHIWSLFSKRFIFIVTYGEKKSLRSMIERKKKLWKLHFLWHHLNVFHGYLNLSDWWKGFFWASSKFYFNGHFHTPLELSSHGSWCYSILMRNWIYRWSINACWFQMNRKKNSCLTTPDASHCSKSNTKHKQMYLLQLMMISVFIKFVYLCVCCFAIIWIHTPCQM